MRIYKGLQVVQGTQEPDLDIGLAYASTLFKANILAAA